MLAEAEAEQRLEAVGWRRRGGGGAAAPAAPPAPIPCGPSFDRRTGYGAWRNMRIEVEGTLGATPPEVDFRTFE